MSTPVAERMPALFISHGAPPLVDDPLWVRQLQELAATLPFQHEGFSGDLLTWLTLHAYS